MTVTTRKSTSYTSTVVSMTLVLYLLGLFGFFYLQAEELKHYYRENFQVNVEFRESAQEGDILRMQKGLESKPYVREAQYISKEEGRQIMQETLGENFVDVLGYNPLPNRLRLYFISQYANPDSIAIVEQQLSDNLMVRTVVYRRGVLENLDRNVRLLGYGLIGLAAILGFISISLINNAIRLHLFSKRILLKSMQLVGATQWFIRRPFLTRALLNGLLASILACALLAFTLVILQRQISFIELVQDPLLLGILASGLTVAGISISLLSSYLALNRFLRMRLEELY